MAKKEDNKKLVLYKDKNNNIQIKVDVDKNTVWLSQKEMATLFDKDVKTVNEHIKNIFKEKELEENSVIRNFRITAADGKNYDTIYYNLDVIISVGYRVKSKAGSFSYLSNQNIKTIFIKRICFE